jgi:hypothetical protein
MPELDVIRVAVQSALARLNECQKQEEVAYGSQHGELNKMEDEAPAPDPCVEEFNLLVAAMSDYLAIGGQREAIDLGKYQETVYQVLKKTTQAQQ